MSELEAMAVIARVLETLPDDARQRVIQWAADRVGVEPYALASAIPQAAAEPIAVSDDPALKLGSLDDMFEARPSDDDLRIDDPVDPVNPVAAAPDGTKPPVAEILKSFAAEFQRFAEEWNGAAAQV